MAPMLSCFLLGVMLTMVKGLSLVPNTPDKEVFTGDSFVITCLDSDRNEGEKLTWVDKDGHEVPRDPSAPIYVSGKSGGLQIVFLKPNKRHSGQFMCRKVKDGNVVEEIPLNIAVYKAIEFQGKANEIAAEGMRFTTQCMVDFDENSESASVVWDKGGTSIGNDLEKYALTETRPPHFKTSLTIKNVSKEDAGVYTCRATQFTKTISQFKQWDIKIRVQYKPKFPANTPSDIWVNKPDPEKEALVDVNLTCIVDADPATNTILWYDGRNMLINRDRLAEGISGIEDTENMSVLRLKYRAPADHHQGQAHHGHQWPQRGGHGDSHSRFTCEASNGNGQAKHTFNLKVGHLPPSPKVLSYAFDDNNLTLTIQEPAVDPPLDYYRIELNGGKSLEFNASDVTAAMMTETEMPFGMPVRGQPARSQRQQVAMVNNTYQISVSDVPKGHHKLTLYAHNPVGWSHPLRDDNLVISVVNGQQGLIASLVVNLVLALVVTRCY
ncbi:hypothetical protein HDE_09810 [Halotydeus destructor]|nr:hypothetical protein HDE_09810 [Halotydeus destructor]